MNSDANINMVTSGHKSTGLRALAEIVTKLPGIVSIVV